MPAGTYDVEFLTGCGNSSNLLGQWYKGQPSQTTATPIKVTAGATRTGVDATMIPGATITGRVTNASGKAFGGVFVEAEGTKVGFGSASTSADGRYTITGLAADTYKVGFSSTTGNYLPQWYKGQPTESTATPLTVSQGATDTGVNARMLLAGRVTGRVTSTKGAGLSGICVAVTEVGEGAPPFATEAVSKAGGSYSVSMLPTGVYAVGFSNCSSETTNYAPMWSGGSSTYSSAKGVRVRGGKTTSGVDARLPVGGAISGRLSNTSGRPLGGICVGANSQDGSSGEATTSKNGSYSVLSLPTGAYTVSFCGNSAGYIEGSFQNDLANPVSVTVGKTTAQVNATLVLGGKIAGHVTNASGKSLSGICVDATGASGGSTAGSATTSRNGDFTIFGLTAGKYGVDYFSGCGNSGGYATEWYKNKSSFASETAVNVTDGRTTMHINASMHLGGTITGTVTGSGTTPLAGVCVTVVNRSSNGGGGSATTAGGGTYSVTGLSTGTYNVDFTPDCGVSGNFSAEWYKQKPSQASATTVRVTAGRTTSGIGGKLSAGGTISGKVTNSKNQPLSAICVSVTGPNAFGEASTGDGGTYSVEDLGTGKYTVLFSTGCGNASNLVIQWFKGKSTSTTATAVSVAAGKTTPGINAKMVPGGTISGTVRNAAGPLLGVCVSVASSLHSGSAITSITGSFAIAGLSSGKYSVGVATNECSDVNLGSYVTQLDARQVSVRTGKTTSGVKITMSPDGEISGVVSASKGGAKLSGICVEASSTSAPGPYEVAITTNGAYKMVQLMPGPYTVEFVAGCGSTRPFASQWYDAKHSQSAATLVRVTADKDAGGINAKLRT